MTNGIVCRNVKIFGLGLARSCDFACNVHHARGLACTTCSQRLKRVPISASASLISASTTAHKIALAEFCLVAAHRTSWVALQHASGCAGTSVHKTNGFTPQDSFHLSSMMTGCGLSSFLQCQNTSKKQDPPQRTDDALRGTDTFCLVHRSHDLNEISWCQPTNQGEMTLS